MPRPLRFIPEHSLVEITTRTHSTTDHSPAPFVHATDDSTEMDFRVRYRAFVDTFRWHLSRSATGA